MLAEGGRLSSPEVGANVGHLFSNAIGQEQCNTIVNYYKPLSSEALSPHGYMLEICPRDNHRDEHISLYP
jgi:hypothetical protein